MQEFTKLLTYVKSKEKDLRARGVGLMRKKVVWCPIDRQTASSYEMSRDTSTPMITGQRPEDEVPTEEDMEEVEGAVLADEISRDAGEFFDQTVATVEGRKRFQQWLFTMTDTNNDEKVRTEELVVMIRALRHDGISPEDLTYDPERLLKDAAKAGDGSEEDQDRYFAKQLLREYDVETHGYLTPAEFQVLASLIIKNYELRHEYIDNPEAQIRLKGFRLARRLGKGANGEVRLAVELKTGARKAVKIVPKRDMAHLSSLDTEITAMMILKHPHIVKLDQVQEDDQNVFFIMELCGGGNISDYLDGTPISETLARFYFQQIVDGVLYCHRTGVAHRDLKLDNILLDNNANIKITDFGHAGIYKSGWDVFQTPLVGGLCHLAPEQILNQPYSGEKHDVWSLGVILYVLLSGHSPFTSHHPQQLLDDIKNVRYVMPKDVSRDAKNLIAAMLVADSADRPLIAQIAKHPWLTQGDIDAPLLNAFALPVPAGFWRRYSCTSESMCHVLKLMDIEPVYNSSTIQNVAEEHMDVRCHWPAKDVRFSFRVKDEKSDGTQILEFRLATGASREFLSLMTKLKSNIAQRIRRNRKHDGTNNPLLKTGSSLSNTSSARSSPSTHHTKGTAAKDDAGDRMSDDIPVEDDGSLRPQIVSLAELHQIEAAIAAEARETEARVLEEESNALKKKTAKNGTLKKKHRELDRSPETSDSETANTDTTISLHTSNMSLNASNASLNTSTGIAAPTPHRHHAHRHPKHSGSGLGLLGPAVPSSYASAVLATSGEDLRRSRSVPAGPLQDEAPVERPGTSTSHRHATDKASDDKEHHKRSSHRTEKDSKDHKDHKDHKEHKEHHHKDSKDSKDHKDQHNKLITSSAPVNASNGASNHHHHHMGHSGHHGSEGDLKELRESQSSTYKRHAKKPSEIPLALIATPVYVPGQVMTQIPGLVAFGGVASEAYTPAKPRHRSKRADLSENESARGKSKSSSSKKSTKSSSSKREAFEAGSGSLPLNVSHERSHTTHTVPNSKLKKTNSKSSAVAPRDLEHSSSCSSSCSCSFSDTESFSSGSGSESDSSWSDEESTPRRGRHSFEHTTSPCSSRASSRGRRSSKHRGGSSTKDRSPSRGESRSRSRKPSVASARGESPVPSRGRTKDQHRSPVRTRSPSRSKSKSRKSSPIRGSSSKTDNKSSGELKIGSSISGLGTSSQINKSSSSLDPKELRERAEKLERESRREREKEREKQEKLEKLEKERERSERMEKLERDKERERERENAKLEKLEKEKLDKLGPLTPALKKAPSGPTNTPSKTGKSFKRTKEPKEPKSSLGVSQSLPVSPKHRKSPNDSISSSSSSSSSISSLDDSSSDETRDDASETSHASQQPLKADRRALALAALQDLSLSGSEDERAQMRSSSHAGILQHAPARSENSTPTPMSAGSSNTKSSTATTASKPQAFKSSQSPLLTETSETSESESPRRTANSVRSVASSKAGPRSEDGSSESDDEETSRSYRSHSRSSSQSSPEDSSSSGRDTPRLKLSDDSQHQAPKEKRNTSKSKKNEKNDKKSGSKTARTEKTDKSSTSDKIPKSHSHDKLTTATEKQKPAITKAASTLSPPARKKTSKSAHHSPEDSTSSDSSDTETNGHSALSKSGHRKNFSLGSFEPTSTSATSSAANTAATAPEPTSARKKSSKRSLEATAEISEESTDSESEGAYYSPPSAKVEDRTQSLNGLKSSKSSVGLATSGSAATSAQTERIASAILSPKRSKSFKKERTKERTKAHDAKRNKSSNLDDS